MEHGIKIYDMYDYYYTPFWHTTWFLIGASLALILACIAGFLYAKKHRGRKKLLRWQEIYGEIAQQKVHEQSVKKFYFDLTRLLKEYLALRYQVSLTGKTDFEVIQLLKKDSLPQELLPLVEQVFMGPQAIKYANQKGQIHQMEEDKKHCITIIRCTQIDVPS